MNIVSTLLSQTGSLNRTKKYQVIPTQNIIDSFEEKNWLLSKFDYSKVRNPEKVGFQKHFIRLRNDSQLFKKLGLFPELIVKNSYDGTSSLKIHFGLFRQVCSNGLVIEETTLAQPLSLSHIGKDFYEKLDSFIEVAEQEYKVLYENILETTKMNMSLADRVSFALKAVKLRLPNKIIHNPLELLTPQREEDNKTDLFSIFNVVQENILEGNFLIESTRKNKPVLVKAREIRGLESNFSFNKDLWNLYQEERKHLLVA